MVDIVLGASYLLSSMPPASSSTSYSSRCIVQLPTVCRSESCANNLAKLVDLLAASYLLSSTPPPSSSTSSRRIVQLPTVCHAESCANNLTKLVDLLVAYYLLSSTPPADAEEAAKLLTTQYSLPNVPLPPPFHCYPPGPSALPPSSPGAPCCVAANTSQGRSRRPDSLIVYLVLCMNPADK